MAQRCHMTWTEPFGPRRVDPRSPEESHNKQHLLDTCCVDRLGLWVGEGEKEGSKGEKEG